MSKKLTLLITIVSIFFIQSCATTSQFNSLQEDAIITIGKTKISGLTPIEGKVPRTTFGKYPVKLKKEGYEPFYGILPLYVDGGVITLDALFFAPAAFFNVQGAFPFYQFDMDNQLILYKKKEKDNWMEYRVPDQEKSIAKIFFGD